MNELAHLFGGQTKISLLRLFLLQPKARYTKKDLTNRLDVYSVDLTKELRILEKAQVIKKVRRRATKTKSTGERKQVVVSAWRLNGSYALLEPLQALLMSTNPYTKLDIRRRLEGVGNLTLVVLSGVFLLPTKVDAKLDLLVVGKKISNTKLKKRIRAFEKELGVEVRYAAFTTEEFEYRKNVNDRLLRDIFDFDHEVVLSSKR